MINATDANVRALARLSLKRFKEDLAAGLTEEDAWKTVVAGIMMACNVGDIAAFQKLSGGK